MALTLDQLLPSIIDGRPFSTRQQKEFDKIIKSINKKDDETRSAEEWFALGFNAEFKQKIEFAIEFYSKTIAVDSSFEVAYKNRAALYLQNNELGSALVDIEEAIELDPQFINAYSIRAGIFSEMGEYEKALKDLDKCLELSPDNASIFARKASVHTTMDQLDEAETFINKAIETDDDSEYLSQRGLIYLFNGKAEVGLKDFKKTQMVSGNNYVIQFNLGLCYGLIEGSDKEAHQYFQKAFKKVPNLLKDYYKTAKSHEVSRLDKTIKSIINRLKSDDNSVGKFYRDELLQLLTAKHAATLER